MGKKQVIDYVMNSPANTNKAVLEGMLDGMGGADVPTPTVEDAGKVLGVNENGKYSFNNVDCGFACTFEGTTLTEENVTTVVEEGVPFAFGGLSYAELISADTIRVTFNGTEYICEKTVGVDDANYGADFDVETQTFDWSEYPFCIGSSETGDDDTPVRSNLATQSAGTYSIKIEAVEETIETTDYFKKAVTSVVGQTQPLILSEYGFSDETTGVYGTRLVNADTLTPITAQELSDAIAEGRTVWVFSSIQAPLRGFVPPSSCGSPQYKALVTTYDGSFTTLIDKEFKADQNTNFEFRNTGGQ